MSEIPHINVSNSEGSNQNEEGSVLIPKLGTVHSKPEDLQLSGSKSTMKPKRKLGKKTKIALITSGVLVVLVLLFAGAVGLMGYRAYKDGMGLKASVEQLVQAGEAQDLPRITSEIANTRVSLAKFESSYGRLTWLSSFPYIGSYVKDGTHGIEAAKHGLDAGDIVLETIEPYADILGLAPDSTQAENGEQTAQERLDFVVSTIPDVVPKADRLSEKMMLIKQEIDQIDPEHYPEEFQGMVVRERLKKGIELVDLASQVITNGKPLLEAAPDLLGSNDPRTYLILFQNDKELRPTGGFLTAYSIATVEKGKFKPVSSNDIYNLDSNYRPSIKAPDPIIDMLQGPYKLSPYLRLRDMNWSPDFEESMDLFLTEARDAGVGDIDGIIAVDTQLLVNLLDAIGPIGVPGFGNFSTENDPRCNCPQVIYELESFADVEGAIVWDQNDPTKIIYAPPNYENRKKIIGPLMNSILSNSLGQSKEKIPALFEAGFDSLLEKHVLFYLLDEKEQQAAEDFGIAGTLKQTDGDYLHISDANLGGRKSNLYVDQQVEQDIEIGKDGSVTKTVTITYTNTEKHDGWLNSVLPSWVRVYVPEGSELIDEQGLEKTVEPYTELGKTVFAGRYSLRPEGVVKLSFSYKLPFKVEGEEYDLLIQKQPGTDAPLHIISLGKLSEELYLRTDKEFMFKL